MTKIRQGNLLFREDECKTEICDEIRRENIKYMIKFDGNMF